ncbi:IS3 family transposase, partial [Lapidilactobacillus gannanensis]
MNKQHRLAYNVIKELSQGKHGALTKLLAVVGVSRQAYYKGLKRKETAWEVRNHQLQERVQHWFDLHRQGIGAGNLLVNLQHDESITFEVTHKMIRRVMRELGLRCQI